MSFILQLCLAIFISSFIWIILCVSILSSGVLGELGPLGTIIFPISQSLKYGTIIGASHGLILGLIILLRKPDSYVGYVFSSIIAAEIFLLVAFVVFIGINYLNNPVGSKNSRTDSLLTVVFLSTFTVIFYYILFSIVFLIPNVLTGFINRFLVKFLSNQN